MKQQRKKLEVIVKLVTKKKNNNFGKLLRMGNNTKFIINNKIIK